jgi:hypothetical protein
MARVYGKSICPYCGKSIGNNNFKRHLRTHSQNAEVVDCRISDNSTLTYDSVFVQQNIEIPENSVVECVEHNDDLIDVIAFDISAFNFYATEVKFEFAFNGIPYDVYLNQNEIFISWALRKLYVRKSTLIDKINYLPEMLNQTHGLYKPIFGDRFCGYCRITNERWERREVTRRFV